MKKLYIIAMLITACISTRLQAQNFHILDINDSKDSHPSNNSLFDQPLNDYLYGKLEYAVLNGAAYFTADDGIHGAELWRSDGTPEGTKMVKDINPGAQPSNISSITVSGNKIFFRADDGGFYGQELWVSDGTEVGTTMVLDISPFGGSTPSFLTDVNGTLYFFVNYYATTDQLWKSDGTAGGTVMVADFFPLFGLYNATQLTNVDGRLFFVLDAYEPELYTSDGTTEGTHMVKDINPFGGSNPSSLTAVNGLLYFSADDGSGRQLWVSDGSDAGTYMINNPRHIYVDDFYGVTFTIRRNNIYFSGNIPDGDGSRLCTFNTSNITGNVRAVKDINPGYSSHNLYNITNVNGTLFFTVYNGIDQVLWKSDGTEAGTMQLKNINPGGRNIYLYKSFVNADGTLLFPFYDDANGYEVWKSDGTEAGTIIVKEINPGAYSSQAANITYIGNGLSLFEATDGKRGLELWKTDGTEAGTSLVKNINKTTSGSSNPYALTPTADDTKLMFVATDPQYGTELRITDGTTGGTSVVKDLFKGSFSSSPFLFAGFKNETYFFANILNTADHTTSDIRTTVKLCKTDGTKTRTKILSLPSFESYINETDGYLYAMESTSDLLYIIFLNYSTYSYELWRTDGTAAGTFPLKTDMPAYYSVELKGVGNKLFFTYYDFSYGQELFVTNGSIAGTGIVKDIAQGYNSSFPSNLTSFNNKLYFTADEAYGRFLWSSDGTENGTKLQKPVTVNAYSLLVPLNGKLFFTAMEKVGKGVELYANDGDHTMLIKDIYRGPGSSYAYNLLAGDTLVYFLADDGKHGNEIWKSNGTKEGTQLVKNISPDAAGTYPDNMTTVHNELFFTINNVLWQSDGTKKHTEEVNDANLEGVEGLTFFKAFGNKLAFTGYTPSTGTELYVGEWENETFITSKAADTSYVKLNTTVLNAHVYPNPATSKATLEISGKFKDITVSLTDMSGKLIWKKVYKDQSSINLPTEKLAAGMYAVTIQSSNEIKTLKLVKE